MDESSFGGETSEPPSTGLEHDDPPGNSGNIGVLNVAEGTAARSKTYNTGKSSVLNLVRTAVSKAATTRQNPATGHNVARIATSPPDLPERNGVRLDTAHHAGPPQRKENPLTVQFRERFYPDATDEDWDDWRWQSRHRIKTLEQFERILELSIEERDVLSDGGTLLPTAITPYYMSLLDPENPLQALRKTVVPTTREFVRTAGEADDPLGEDGHSPVPGLVHRYPDRVLLLPLDFCSTYCRYCTRSRVVGHGEIQPNVQRLEAIFHYLGRGHSGSRRADFRR